MDDRWTPSADAEVATDADAAHATLSTAAPSAQSHEGFPDSTHVPGHWRYELRRWLATLNPGRTGREYEKAVTYFFTTRGVPQEVAALSFDLLLAYRGALALRAADPARGATHTPTPPPAFQSPNALPTGSAPSLLPGDDHGPEGEHSARDGEDDGGSHMGSAITPLAPATVNIRLTALRQFLVHCAMLGVLADLSPDRIRMALKRLQIDRRRPYQILAESEWEGFLAAAALPATVSPTTGEPSTSATPGHAEGQPAAGRSPWGITRTMRARQAELREAAIADDHTTAPEGGASSMAPLARSRTGLTGKRTSQRDHALIALALATGLRAIEIALLDLGDLVQEWHDGQQEWWLVLPDAKTKGQRGGRTLPLAASLAAELLAYADTTGRELKSAADRATPLFLSNRRPSGAPPHAAAHGRLTAGHIGRIVDRVETQWVEGRDTSAGETRAISPHALRHSTAMALLEGSADGSRPPASVEHVRGWLGHFDIRTTQGYLAHLDARQHRRALKIALPAEERSGNTASTEADRGSARPGFDSSPQSPQSLQRPNEPTSSTER